MIFKTSTTRNTIYLLDTFDYIPIAVINFLKLVNCQTTARNYLNLKSKKNNYTTDSIIFKMYLGVFILFLVGQKSLTTKIRCKFTPCKDQQLTHLD